MILLLSSRNRLKYVDIVGPEFDAVSLVCRDSSKVVSLANGKRHAIKWTNQSLMQIRGTKLEKTRVHWLCFTFVTFRFNFTTHWERALYWYSSITLGLPHRDPSRFPRQRANTEWAFLSYEILKTNLAKKLRPPLPKSTQPSKKGSFNVAVLWTAQTILWNTLFTLSSQIPRNKKKTSSEKDWKNFQPNSSPLAVAHCFQKSFPPIHFVNQPLWGSSVPACFPAKRSAPFYLPDVLLAVSSVTNAALLHPPTV